MKTFFAHDLRLTQSELAEILEERQLLEQLRQAIDEVLARALSKGISKADIEQVLLVGRELSAFCCAAVSEHLLRAK
jgi:ketopantoate reductase